MVCPIWRSPERAFQARGAPFQGSPADGDVFPRDFVPGCLDAPLRGETAKLRCSARLAAVALALLAAVGCSAPNSHNDRPPLPGETPEETLTNYRRDLWHGDYRQAYGELCEETRKRYSYGRWSTFMSRTKVGALLEMVFIDWFLYSVRFSPDQKWAYIVFADPHDESASKEFKMVNEGGKWKLWFSFAELFGMPDEDETNLGKAPEKADPPK